MLLLVSCATARHTAPAEAEALPHLVLILGELPDGQVTHEWQRAEELELSQYRHRAGDPGVPGRIVLVSGRPRDCDQELVDCHRECMKRPVPPEYNQYEYNRGLGGREDYCNKQCLPSYMDCKELEKLRPQEFSAVDAAVDWLKRHRKALLVGSTVVIAGVVFVVVSAGAGAVVLAPVLLIAS
ncbi:hypothetical protein [Archangium sp.]|uniref:hypothetical protein n=1 Tax=Archangium sp. TaxID=1872627 RepID=UPI00389A2266